MSALALPPEIVAANKTARSAGAVGERAKLPAFIRRWAMPGQTLLDFGAGPEAIHTKALREMGLDVVAHDFGANVTPGLHDRDALSRRYDLVFASNVLNVQDTDAMLLATLDQIAAAVKPDGLALVNLPKAPRLRAWSGTTRDEAILTSLLGARFLSVRRGPTFWQCRKPRVPGPRGP